jgi:hypothetical protein
MQLLKGLAFSHVVIRVEAQFCKVIHSLISGFIRKVGELTTLFMGPKLRLCDPHIQPKRLSRHIRSVKSSSTQATLPIHMRPVVSQILACNAVCTNPVKRWSQKPAEHAVHLACVISMLVASKMLDEATSE